MRQIATAIPACADILRPWPGARRDGRWSLQQLGAFAQQAHVDEEMLLQELSDAAGLEVRTHQPESRRANSPLPMIFTALTVGISLGAAFGVGLLWRIATGGYDVVPGATVHVHGIAQLWGWMTLFIFAIAGQLLRQNTTRPAPRWIERLAAGFILAGLATFFTGLDGGVRRALPAIDIIASSLLLIAAVLFGISIGWSLSGAANGQRRHGLIFLIAWLWVWAVTDLCLRVHYVTADVLPDWARSLLIVLPVLGLATNAIYGFGVRLIPGLLNIGRLRPKWIGRALRMHNVGLCLFLVPYRWCRLGGAVLMFAGSIIYLFGMDALRSKPSRPIYGIDARGHVLVRVAFFWLACGLGMIVAQQFFPSLPHAYSGAWRHALTVGFITTMILGVGYRLLPVFIKQPLASTRLMLVSAGLIIVGNVGRVVLELLTIGGWAWSYSLMGITGIFELAALILFAINIAATAWNRRHVFSPGEPLEADTRVQEAVNARPQIQDRLRELGITMFDQAAFIAPSMTLGALALASGMQPRRLIEALRGDIPQSVRHAPRRAS